MYNYGRHWKQQSDCWFLGCRLLGFLWGSSLLWFCSFLGRFGFWSCWLFGFLWCSSLLGFLCLLCCRLFFGFFSVLGFSPILKEPEAPVPLDCFKDLFFTPARSANFKWLLTDFSSFPTLKFFMMYFRIACLEEPPLSFKEVTACAIISLYFG